MKEAAFLVTVYPVIGGIKIQDQLLRCFFKRSDELLDYHFMHPNSGFPVCPVLPPTQGRTAGQFLGAPQRRLDGQIKTQALVVVEVFITQCQCIDSLP